MGLLYQQQSLLAQKLTCRSLRFGVTPTVKNTQKMLLTEKLGRHIWELLYYLLNFSINVKIAPKLIFFNPEGNEKVMKLFIEGNMLIIKQLGPN